MRNDPTTFSDIDEEEHVLVSPRGLQRSNSGISDSLFYESLDAKLFWINNFGNSVC